MCSAGHSREQARGSSPLQKEAVLAQEQTGRRVSLMWRKAQARWGFTDLFLKKQNKRLKKSFISNPPWGCGWEENKLRRMTSPLLEEAHLDPRSLL